MMMENGIKPAWVFDGAAHDLKEEELMRRKELKMKAAEELKEAIEDGDFEKQKAMAQRTVHVTKEMTADAKRLVNLMGLPCIEAPGEAEAQCARLAKAGKAYATLTEDMDALTFGTPVLVRNLNSKKEPISEINLEKVLEEMKITMDEFIDLCILLGCDFSKSIKGVGQVKAFKYIKDKSTIEEVLKQVEKDNLKKQKYVIPEEF